MTGKARERGADGATPTRLGGRWSEATKAAFLKALSRSLNVTHAARVVGRDRSAAYHIKARDPAFARGWAEALHEAYGELEGRLLDQAINGTTRTETVRNSDGSVRLMRIVHSYPLGIAMGLLAAHRDAVIAHRAGGNGKDLDDAAIAAVKADMERVRARLRGHYSSGSEEPEAGAGTGEG